jgi:hypothetical protein
MFTNQTLRKIQDLFIMNNYTVRLQITSNLDDIFVSKHGSKAAIPFSNFKKLLNKEGIKFKKIDKDTIKIIEE